MFRVSSLITLGVVFVVCSASVIDNRVYETPRINSNDELISTIVNDCFEGNTMTCLKGKVLTYLDTYLGMKEEQGRSYQDGNVDKVIFDRVARVLATNEIRVQLPETIFSRAVVSYRSDRGLDLVLPTEEARGHLLKKKLLFPILLLLKLKMKALMPIIVGIVGIKAMKALILSKLAITLVLGFIIFQLVSKSGMAMPMSMMPMMPPAEPMPYGAPAPAPTTASSYDPSSWDSSNSGGPYSRVWEPSSSASAHNSAYSAYYPKSSSSSLSSGSSSGSSSLTGSSSSGSSNTY